MVTHDLESLYTVCDRIAALADGKVVADRADREHARIRTPLGENLFPGQARRHAGRPAREQHETRNLSDGNPCPLCPDRSVHARRDPRELSASSIGSRTKAASGQREVYQVHFQGSVSGLLVGSAVLFNGIRVGEVTELSSIPKTRHVDATIAVRSATPVRADTKVGLDFQGLTGVPVVGAGRRSATRSLRSGLDINRRSWCGPKYDLKLHAMRCGMLMRCWRKMRGR